MKVILFFFIAPIFLFENAIALTFSEVLLGQTAANPIVADQYIETISPALGFGTYSNSITPDSNEYLEHTNANFFILGLDLNGYSTHVFLPYKDDAKSREARVDSDVLRLQSGMKLFDQYHIDFLYSHAKGFFSGELDSIEKPLVLYPNVGVRRWGIMFTAMKDPKHKSTLNSPIIYLKPETSKSIYFAGEIISHRLHGLDALIQTEKTATEGILSSVKMTTGIASIGFSQSKMYENFFWSYSIGIGLGTGLTQTTSSTKQAEKWDVAATVPATGSFGWIKHRLTLGIFAQTRSWQVRTDQISLGSNNGTTGLYGSVLF